MRASSSADSCATAAGTKAKVASSSPNISVNRPKDPESLRYLKTWRLVWAPVGGRRVRSRRPYHPSARSVHYWAEGHLQGLLSSVKAHLPRDMTRQLQFHDQIFLAAHGNLERGRAQVHTVLLHLRAGRHRVHLHAGPRGSFSGAGSTSALPRDASTPGDATACTDSASEVGVAVSEPCGAHIAQPTPSSASAAAAIPQRAKPPDPDPTAGVSSATPASVQSRGDRRRTV